MSYTLVADIGGTNARFGLLKINYKENTFEIVCRKDFKTQDYTDIIFLIQDVLSSCIDKCKTYPQDAVFAIAGKVDKNKAILTHCPKLKLLKYEIVSKTVLKNVVFLNDLEALSYSLNALNEKEDFFTINKKKGKKDKSKLILGSGTGFGECVMIYDKNCGKYLPQESEGGHNDFPILTKEEFDMIDFIKKEENLDTIRIEDLVSGAGLERIYKYLTHTKLKESKTLKANEISKLAKEKDKLAKETFSFFFRFLARTAKNFTLENLSEGGVYLSGGVINKNLEQIVKSQFLKEFTLNTYFENFLKKIPISIITNKDATLLGLGEFILHQVHCYKEKRK